MKRLPDTRVSLVHRLRDREQTAWDQFVEIYSGVILAYCRRRGFQDADAADLLQEILHSVARAMPRFDYDPQKGAFRSWLFTICRNHMRTFLAKAQRKPGAAGGTKMNVQIQEIPDDRADEEIWNRQHELYLFAWAMNRVEPEFQPATWKAFIRVAVEHHPVDQVAADLGISRGAVYIAKSRVISRIRREIETVEGS